MRVYAAKLICSAEVLGFQTFKLTFCIYDKLHSQFCQSGVRQTHFQNLKKKGKRGKSGSAPCRRQRYNLITRAVNKFESRRLIIKSRRP